MASQILVPLDGSERAAAALPHAAILARARGHELLLLRVVPSTVTLQRMTWPTAGGQANNTGIGAEVSQAHTYLGGVAGTWMAADLPVRTEVRQGDAASEILACLEQHPEISLLAMTTHGYQGLSHLIFGSVAERVVQAARVPLLLVHSAAGAPPPRARAYRTILVPLDGSPCAERALDQAVELARALGATLLLVTITFSSAEVARGGLDALWLLPEFQRQDEALAAALTARARQLAASGLTVRAQVIPGDPASEILGVATREAVDLIVMGTHGRNGLERFWLGSVALDVVRQAHVPVLLARAPVAAALPAAAGSVAGQDTPATTLPER